MEQALEDKDKTNTWIITATPPTPNGDLHVGHLSGPYFAGDVFARGRKLKGEKAIFVSSGDDNQSYVVTSAEAQNVDPYELATKGNEDIKKTLHAANIDIDVFNRPDPEHNKTVQNFFNTLFENGKLIEKEVSLYFDPDKGRYLFESYIGGNCPSCLEPTKGSICECCGHPNNPSELITPYVVNHTSANLEKRTVKQLFLPIEDYRKDIVSFYGEAQGKWRRHLLRLVDELLEQGLEDYPVTYPSDWGVAVNLDGWQGHVWNVWAEMLPGLMHSTKLGSSTTENEDEKWLEENDAQLVQFLGFDNSYFFAIAHLSLLFAYNSCSTTQNLIKPKYIITNEFYRLEQKKFSTSMNHVIWGRDLLERVTPDAKRLYLALSNPELTQTNFVEAEMFECIQERFMGPLQKLIANWSDATQEFDGSKELNTAPEWISNFSKRLQMFLEPETFSIIEYGESLLSYLNFIDKRIAQISSEEDLSEMWHAFSALAIFVSPIMPNFSNALAKHTGMNTPLSWRNLEPKNQAAALPNNIFVLRANQPSSVTNLLSKAS